MIKFNKWLKLKLEQTEEDQNFQSATIGLFCNNKILLLHRSSTAPWMPLKYALSGGGIEKGESPKEAARRELEEETKIHANPNFVKKITTDYVNYLHYGIVTSDRVTLNFEHDHYLWADFQKCQELDSQGKFVPGLMQLITILNGLGLFGKNA
mgnify:CR=1 FL=1